jgi:hypothetical protein
LLGAGNATQGFAGPALLGHVPLAKCCEPPSTLRGTATIFAGHGLESRLLDVRQPGRGCSVRKSCSPTTPRIPVPDSWPVGRTKIGLLWVYARDDRPSSGADPAAANLCLQPNSSGRASTLPSEVQDGRRSSRRLRRVPATDRVWRYLAGGVLVQVLMRCSRRPASRIATETLRRTPTSEAAIRPRRRPLATVSLSQGR